MITHYERGAYPQCYFHIINCNKAQKSDRVDLLININTFDTITHGQPDRLQNESVGESN